jgi:quercetin dioxygenase-like cupin family protein
MGSRSVEPYNNNSELEKGTIHIVVEIIEYVEGAVVTKTIIRKSTGNVSAMSFDAGTDIGDKISPFDNFIQVIEGTAELVINKKVHHMGLGKGIIIPAHTQYFFNAREKFKIISTVIKSGYEE